MRKSKQALQSQINAISAISDPHDSFAAFCTYLPSYGFKYAISAYLVNPFMQSLGENAGILTNWNPDWIKEWRSTYYLFHDPVALHLMRSNTPFSWDDAYEYHDTTISAKLRQSAIKIGMKNGLAIPILRPKGPRGAVSLATENNQPLPQEWTNIVALSTALFYHIESVSPTRAFDLEPRLTHREIEVLYLVAAGKTNWEAGKMLGISEHSVRDHLKSISKKLETTNRAHSVARAIQIGLIIP